MAHVALMRKVSLRLSGDKIMKFLNKAILIGAALACSIGSANAATVVLTGTTSGAPTYNRTLAGNPPTGLSSAGADVAYQALVFNVDQAGSYQLTLSSAFDNFLTLYQGAFNPASPLTNALQADDDSRTGFIGDARITRNLLAGTSYTAVATAFASGVSGAFTLEATGPGTASFGNRVGAVPEPSTWAMMLVGFGAVGFSMRRRKSSGSRAMQVA